MHVYIKRKAKHNEH